MAPQHPRHSPGLVPTPRRSDNQDTSPLAGALSHTAAQTDQQHGNGPLRPSPRIMPYNAPGETPGSPRQHTSNGTAGIHRSNSASFSRRPSSAPRASGSGGTNNTTDDEDENRLSLRPQKPPLFRSQSEYASPFRDEAAHTENEDFEWGARHGFEDHYQSEDIISQLANVSCSPLRFSTSPLSFEPGVCIEDDIRLGMRCQSCEEGGCSQVRVCWVMDGSWG
jgi:hypothetical protein